MKGKLKKGIASLMAVILCTGSVCGFAMASNLDGVPTETGETFAETQESFIVESSQQTEQPQQTEQTEQTQQTQEPVSEINAAAVMAVDAVEPAAIDYNQVTVTPDNTQQKYTICVKNISAQDVQRIYIPVWSRNNGQDDIRWYTASKMSDGSWECTIDIKNHKSDVGIYDLHVYSENSAGVKTILNAGTFSVTGISSSTVRGSAVNASSGIYRVEVEGLSSPAGISEVRIPVWSEKNGQDDIVWYDAKKSGSVWYADVDIKQHGYDAGTYNAHIYAYDNRGVESLSGSTKFSVTQMPSNQVQVDLNADQSKATITLKNAKLQSGTEYVSFPVWGDVSGQNDIIWYRANKLDTYTYQVTIPISNHKECGTYEVHAYGVKGSSTTLLGSQKFNVDGIAGNIKVVSKDDVNGYFTLEVADISAPAEITEVQIPVWSQKNGQDDIRWYNAEKSGNKWTVTVDVGDHKLDTGVYNAHVYVTDSRGIHGLIAATTVDVKKPSAAATVTAELLSDEISVKITASNVVGASKVQVPVWGEKNGQNDIIWYDMKQIDSRTWQTTISLGDHMETGKYQAHAYATVNNSMQLCAGTTFQVDEIVANIISFSNRDDETGNFTVNVQNVTGISNVNTVLVGVWSAADGQDDLTWYSAKKSGNKWSANIETINHNYDRGIYYVHIYAYNAAGQSLFVNGLTTEVVINGKLGFIREGNSVYYYPTIGKKAYGFERINGDRYFFDRTTGAMAVGWTYIDGYKYYFDGYGKMVQDIDSLIGLQSSYILKINKQSNCVTMYAYDPATASYCIPVKSMLCSTGDATPLGTYPLGRTYRWLLMYNGTYCQYLSLITGDYLIHSITYERYGDIYSLQTVGYNQLGVNKSAGCVRLRCGEAYWVYNLVNSGRLRQVTIYNSSVPGPFDKPYYAPIPDNQTWDPTDPAIR